MECARHADYRSNIGGNSARGRSAEDSRGRSCRGTHIKRLELTESSANRDVGYREDSRATLEPAAPFVEKVRVW